MGRRTARPDATTPEEMGLPEPVLALATLSGPLEPTTLFGGEGPVELEIGFGKARFLVSEARARGDTHFLGAEWAAPFLRLARHRVLEARLANVRLVHAEATDLLRRLIPAASLQAVHVLFPDPWPKRRHQHRRLLRPDNIRLIARALAPGGALNVATDHADYAAAIPPAVAEVAELEPAETFLIAGELRERTHYAAKMSARGAVLFARSWRRRR